MTDAKKGICFEPEGTCHLHGMTVYECSTCGGLTCAECEYVDLSDEHDFEPVKCGICNAPNIGHDAWFEQFEKEHEDGN